MSIGGKASKANQYSQSTSSGINYGGSSGGSFVDPNQAPFLEQLRNMAMGGFNGSNSNISSVGNTTGNAMTNALGNLGGLGNTQQVIDAQLTGLKSGLGELQQQGINQIGDNAATAGAFGGSRQGLSESALRGEIGDAFTRGYGDIMANASNQAINANNSVFAGGNQLLANQMSTEFGPLQMLQGLLGDPTILSQNESFNFGQTESQSTGQGSSNSAGFQFGIK